MSLPKLPTRSTPLAAFAVLLLIGSSLVGCGSDEDGAASGQTNPATNGQAEVQPTATIEIEYIYADFAAYVNNTEELVKNVDDVFVCTILSAGEAFALNDETGLLWTPFTVQVEQRLLGTVEGTITLIQMGGFDRERNVLVLLHEVPLLEVGETYMLATLNNRDDDRPEWDGLHFVTAFKGKVRIQDRAHRQDLIQEYSDAIDKAGLGS